MTADRDRFILDDWNAVCAQCGREGRASQMRRLPPGIPGGGMYVHPEHYVARNPQDFTRGIPERQVPGQVQAPPEDTFAELQEVLTNDAETDLLDSADWLTADTGEVLTA